MPVYSPHIDYNFAWDRWDLVRSIVNNTAEHRIRTVDVNDPKRSLQYKQDAILTNFTRLTKIGLVGLIFRKPETIVMPPELDYLNDDATGYNFGLSQLAQHAAGEILVTGRYGLLVDYPKSNGDDLSPDAARIVPYIAENIINWRYEQVGSKYKLCLLVLREYKDKTTDGFLYTRCYRYRVLQLIDGIYTQTVWDEVEGAKLNNEYMISEQAIPVDYNGNYLTEIPFTFIGSENNDAQIDAIPLYDLATINLGHYKNSADYEESIFITGQPFLHVDLGETDQEVFRAANPNGIKFGSRGGLLTNGGHLELVQANPNQLADAAMARKEEQAAAIGARLIAPPGGRETAEAARIRFGSQNSALYTITKNMALAFEDALYWVAVFMMETPVESELEINDQFYEENSDPTMVVAQLQAYDRGLMKPEEVRANLRASGVELDEDDNVNPVDPLAGIDPNVIA